MEARLGLQLVEDAGDRRLADVELLEAGPLRDVVAPPGGQVVDDPDLKAALEEQIDHVAPDEARPARDDGSLHVSFAAWTALTL